MKPTNVSFSFNPRKLVPTKIKPSTVFSNCFPMTFLNCIFSGPSKTARTSESSAPWRSEWTEEQVEKLMEIYWEMKAQSDKNDWIYVSEKLGTGHTNEACRIKVTKTLHSEEGQKKAQQNSSSSPLVPRSSPVTSRPSSAAEQTRECKIWSWLSASKKSSKNQAYLKWEKTRS